MKTIFDIYDIEECCNAACANPGNTVGMGNPMPPGEGQVGSEPMTGKCKKEKSKKRKCSEPWTEPVVKEGILDNIEDTLAAGSETMEFIEWYVDNQLVEHKKLDRDIMIKNYINVISVNNGVATINIKNDKESFADEMVIKNPIPNNIHTIKVYNCLAVFHVLAYIADISDIDFEIYKDEGRTYASLWCSWHRSVSGEVSVGNIVCDAFRVLTPLKVESLIMGKDSVILEFDVSRTALTKFFGPLHSADEITFNKNLVKHTLQQAGVIPWGCKFNIK